MPSDTPRPPTPEPAEQAIQAIRHFFEALAPADLARLDQVYAPQARFKDPFNDVQGPAAIAAVFAHMFRTLEQPRFVITGQVLQGQQCFLLWEFRFGFRRHRRGQTQTVHGSTHLVLDEHGRIALHRDYWDTAEELYEKLPLLGGLVRWLRRQATA